MSNLFVDKISGKSGTSSGAPITLSGDTATLGSGVTNNAGVASGTIASGVAFPAKPTGATGGHILQTVLTEYNTATPISSNDVAAPTSTGLTCAITPLYAGSVLLAQIYIHVRIVSASNLNSEAGCAFRVYDGSSLIYDETDGVAYHAYTGAFVWGGSTDASDEIRVRHPIMFTTSAVNTSARTYTVKANMYTQNYTPTVHCQYLSAKSQFILQELTG